MIRPTPIAAGAPAGGVSTLPTIAPELPTTNAASRQLFRGVQVIDTEGNFASMSDLHQRVLLLVAYGVKEPGVIGNDFAADMTAQIRSALKPLTNTRPPALVIDSIVIGVDAGVTTRTVVFHDGTRLSV